MLRLSSTLAACLALGACLPPRNQAASAAATDARDGWPAYGRDAGGARHSPLAQVNRENVATLRVAWTYRTGDVSDGTRYPRRSTFEATPILAFGTLYVSTPFARVIALDPETGRERWTFDAELNRSTRYMEAFAARGVSAWEDSTARPGAPCARRIFLGTLDARLLALDAMTGRPCADFGYEGEVPLARTVGPVQPGEYGVTSPPAVVRGVVVVGSSIGDNRAVELERGTVRAFDARTGRPRWRYDPIPRAPGAPGWATWDDSAQAARTGAANAWSVIVADPARDLVFVPTGSPSPDYYGGERLGADANANSVVALRASTGEVVWAFQVVHHDLWDYDVAAPPVLTTVRRGGRAVAAVAVLTKQGHVFLLDRETGAPLLPVEERPVPASTVPGERASPTQPFPTATPNLVGDAVFTADSVWGRTPEDRAQCRAALAHARADGPFTPPSLEGTVVYPGSLGGVNWGGGAAHEGRGLLVTGVNRLVQLVTLIPRDSMAAATGAGRRIEGLEFANQRGTPYGMSRRFLTLPNGMPCSAPPWGTLVAVDLATGAVRWRVPVGAVPALAGVPGSEAWGSPSIGGPIVTSGDLVFMAGAMDDYLRAFDLETGRELWKGRLPAGGQATPMTYRSPASGRQFVVVAAGGHGSLGTTLGDYVVAFALPR